MNQIGSNQHANHGGLRRARVACANCRERKIKCDVTQRGFPCLHCKDADVPCFVKERKNARNKSKSITRLAHRGSASEAARARSTSEHDLNAEERQSWDSGPEFLDTTQAQLSTASVASIEDQLKFGDLGAANNPLEVTPSTSDPPASLSFDAVDMELLNIVGLNNAFFPSDDYSSVNEQWPTGGARDTAPSRGLSPTTHPLPPAFHDNARRAWCEPDMRSSHDDPNFSTDEKILSSQGCLSVPHPTTIRTLGQLYFEFVHPNLPIISEAEFWDALSDQDEVQFNSSKFPLVVLQAILFSAISFAPKEVALECGSTTTKAARMTFYKRTKLLIELEYEPDPLRHSQASLLLTWHSPAANMLRVNSKWLLVAIHLARVAGADRFQQAPEGQRRRALKRLWWGCILRDRIMPLGTRRAVCIHERVIQERDNGHYLNKDDFSDELGRSLVHDIQQQERIYRLVNTACRLADVLTPTLLSLFRPSSPGISLDCLDQEGLGPSVNSITELRLELEEWQRFASCQFPYPVALGDEPRAVVLLANLLFIYYDTAIIHLSHKYLITKRFVGQSTVAEQDLSKRITAAVDDITERTTEIVQLGLGKYTPISLGAYLPFPLLLHALNAHASNESGDAALCAQDKRKLNIFTRVLSEQLELYEGSGFPCEVIDKIVAYANGQISTVGWDVERGSGGNFPAMQRTMFRWHNLLKTRLRLYLRLAWHIDLAFCTSMPPKEEDFPSWLSCYPRRAALEQSYFKIGIPHGWARHWPLAEDYDELNGASHNSRNST